MARKVATKTISLLVDHVFMPRDLMDDRSDDTARYPGKVDGKRAKYEVNAEIADLLISRDQAIEVAPDVLPEG